VRAYSLCWEPVVHGESPARLWSVPAMMEPVGIVSLHGGVDECVSTSPFLVWFGGVSERNLRLKVSRRNGVILISSLY
jgi:hypothetical protein